MSNIQICCICTCCPIRCSFSAPRGRASLFPLITIHLQNGTIYTRSHAFSYISSDRELRPLRDPYRSRLSFYESSLRTKNQTKDATCVRTEKDLVTRGTCIKLCPNFLSPLSSLSLSPTTAAHNLPPPRAATAPAMNFPV
jgi:hypothetical protein